VKRHEREVLERTVSHIVLVQINIFSVDHTSIEIFGNEVESTPINFCVTPAFPIMLHCCLESPNPDFSRSPFVRADALKTFRVSKMRGKVLLSLRCNLTVYIVLLL